MAQRNQRTGHILWNEVLHNIFTGMRSIVLLLSLHVDASLGPFKEHLRLNSCLIILIILCSLYEFLHVHICNIMSSITNEPEWNCIKSLKTKTEMAQQMECLAPDLLLWRCTDLDHAGAWGIATELSLCQQWFLHLGNRGYLSSWRVSKSKMAWSLSDPSTSKQILWLVAFLQQAKGWKWLSYFHILSLPYFMNVFKVPAVGGARSKAAAARWSKPFSLDSFADEYACFRLTVGLCSLIDVWCFFKPHVTFMSLQCFTNGSKSCRPCPILDNCFRRCFFLKSILGPLCPTRSTSKVPISCIDESFHIIQARWAKNSSSSLGPFCARFPGNTGAGVLDV